MELEGSNMGDSYKCGKETDMSSGVGWSIIYLIYFLD